MKKIFLLLVVSLMLVGVVSATDISNCEELQDMKYDLTADYYLTSDIDCSDTVDWNDGAGFEPIGDFSNKFTGTFDGQNHIITGLYINRGGENSVGLFGSISGTIKNANLEDVGITGGSQVGGLVGRNHGTITNSYATGSVTGSMSVGGLVGFNSHGTITNSYATGSVSGSVYCVGGLVGANSYGTITNSYATGDASGGSQVGGLVGRFYSGTITNSYATGSVAGSEYVGGLVGLIDSGTIINSYWNNHAGNPSVCVGLGSSAGCVAIEDSESYFYYSSNPPMDLWDFVDIWAIYEGVSYPYLQWRIIDAIDADEDGIPDDEDNCPETVADVPTKGLGTNRWIWNGFTWETKLPEGGGPQKMFTMEDTHGCSCFQILNSMGGKMTGHWKFGCSISVMEDFIMSLPPVLVDTVYVDSANMDGADSEIILESETNYRFEAMGTWRDNSKSDHYIDAEYTTFDGWTTYLDGTPNWGPNQKDLQVDDSFVDWGSYSDVNTYYLDYAGTGSTVNFRVFDGEANSGTGPEAGWYPDNVGNLIVNIYELP